jgi:acetyltransferase-like isoleucine patch superfamily enzyme
MGGIAIGKDCEIFSGAKFVGSFITIGDNCFISAGVTISGLSAEGFIRIGNNCCFGPDVYMTTGTHHIGSSKRRSGRGIHKPIIIGDGCGISVRAIPLAGVSIGPGSIIGPGVVLSKDVPANTMVGQADVRMFKLGDAGISW